MMEKQITPYGYKQTEVGVIPEDWYEESIINLCQIMTGNTPSTNQPEYYGDKYLFVSPADLKGQKYINQAIKKLSTKGFSISRKYPKGSVLFTCIGSTIGKCGIAGEELTSNQQINAVLPSSSIVSEYLYYQLSYTAHIVKRQAGEQAVPLVNKTQFGEHRIAIPNCNHEQTAIANALSDVDALITSIEKLISKKQAIKTATMQQLLTGKKRLPPFDKYQKGGQDCTRKGQRKGTQQTELGEIPEDWTVETITSISAVPMQNGLFYEPSRKGQGISLINVGDMYKSAPIDVEQLELFNANIAEIKTFRVSSGDLFFTRSSIVPSGIAFCNIYESENIERDVVFDSHLIRVRVNTKMADAKYVYLASLSNLARKFLISSAKTATMTTIDQGAIKNCPILLPSLEEQKLIIQILSDMDFELEGIKKRLAKTQQIKQGMMQELLTGKTRLI
jgi:type I restriction enzyme S subunit